VLYPIIAIIFFLISLFEVAISRKNSNALIEKGAIDVAPHLLPLMVAVYGLKFAGSLIEYFITKPDLSILWAAIFVGLLIAAKALKFWAVSTLGPYWSMKVLIVPGTQTVNHGPYRWIRHPNYVAVMMEIIALPLIGKAFITATVVTILFAILLYLRINAEEQALIEYTDYDKTMTGKRRFIP
jgi:methyltransferase